MEDPRGGPGRDVGPLGRSGTSWETLMEVWGGLGDPWGVPKRVRGLLKMSGMGWGALGEFQNGSGDCRRGSRWVG